MVGYRSSELAAMSHTPPNNPTIQANANALADMPFVLGYIASLLLVLAVILGRSRRGRLWYGASIFLVGMALACCCVLLAGQAGLIPVDGSPLATLRNAAGYLTIGSVATVLPTLRDKARFGRNGAVHNSLNGPAEQPGNAASNGEGMHQMSLTARDDAVVPVRQARPEIGPLSLDDALAGTGIGMFARDEHLNYRWACNPIWPAADAACPASDPNAPFEHKLVTLQRLALEQNKPVSAAISVGSGEAQRWYEAWIKPGTLSEGGRGVIGVVMETTPHRREEVEFRHRMQEATHRAKNLLAVIQSIARLSARSLALPASVADIFTARIQALASAYDLLVREDWQGIELADVVTTQINQMTFGAAASYVECSGPRLRLRPTAVQTLALAMHELAANARKYGALSAPGGRVQIRWAETTLTNGHPGYLLTWQEIGGPRVEPPDHRGFGYEILDRLTPRGLRGEALSLYLPEGYRWELRFPASNVEQPARPAPIEA